jgi:DNA-binding Xre family transcriptional regulator
MKNEDIRAEARIRNVKLWELAEYIGISQSTLTVWLRHELSDEKKAVMLEAITTIAGTR